MGPDRSVVLTGFMGTGKSTIGRLLAKRLDAELVDTDALIEQRHGPIADIFARVGEDGFRDLERELGVELTNRTKTVISTGGRFMLDPVIATTLGRSAAAFCLTASVDTVAERTLGGRRQNRPLLNTDDPRQTIVDLLAERRVGYGRFPQVATDHHNPDTIAADLATLARLSPTRRLCRDGATQVIVGVGVLAAATTILDTQDTTVVIANPADADSYGLWASGLGRMLVIDEHNATPGSVAEEVGLVTTPSVTLVSLGNTTTCQLASDAASAIGARLIHCPLTIDAMLAAADIGTPTNVLADVAALQRTPLEDVKATIGRPELQSLDAPGTLRPLQRAVAAAIG